MGSTIDEISDSLQRGQGKRVVELVRLAVDEGNSIRDILDKGFLKGMEQVSKRFEKEEVGVPEILSVTRTMDQGIEALHRYTREKRQKNVGNAVLGTVNGNLHDIGKNLVKLMLEGRGIRVIDLGADVSPAQFYEETMASNAKVLILSGILSTSGEDMKAVIDEFEFRGDRDQVFIMVGGYDMDEEQARKIGADCYTSDAGKCAEKAWQYLTQKGKKRRKTK